MCADITACDDKECPSKEKCYRYMCKKCEYRQSYFGSSPREKNALLCDEFWDIKIGDPSDDTID